MDIIFASDYGFCMGVTRAVKLIESLLVKFSDRKIVTIGPLIHNPWFLRSLESRGVFSVSAHDEIPSGSIAVIRTHGLPPQVIETLKKKGVELVDATCPRVSFSQKLIADYGGNVIIAGDPDHGEVNSLCGFAKNAFVIKRSDFIKELELEEAILIAQTTFSNQEFDAIATALKGTIKNLIIKKTICFATEKRQKAVDILVKKVDALLVIGGRQSSNTRRLYEIGRQSRIPCWQVEELKELPREIINYNKVGITAGASTPDDLIQKVIQQLKEMK